MLVLVSATIIINEYNQILLAERPKGKHLAGTWEFPGGKIEPNETAEAAVIREIYEELNITIDKKDLTPFTFVSHDYENMSLLMVMFTCRKWLGEISPQEGQKTCWSNINDLKNYEMPPADLPLIPILQQGLKL